MTDGEVLYPMLSTVPQPSLIYRPGVRILAPGVERYRVLGAGSTVVSVKAGDVIDLTDIEGGQSCEITFCDESGRFDCLALGARANGRGEGLKALLANETECTQRTKSTLQRRNIDLGQAET
ncbi:MAG: aminomethyltransferase, partial [Aestuariivirga sp.]